MSYVWYDFKNCTPSVFFMEIPDFKETEQYADLNINTCLMFSMVLKIEYNRVLS